MAFERNNNFNYNSDNPKFREASLFTNANLALEWFMKYGFSLDEKETIGIGVNSTIAGSINNAAYIPADFTENRVATIRIGNGDGIDLQNLALDADIIEHEFGHHVVYRKLKSTVGESLVVHEGLAYGFVALINDSSCFAQTICPVGSRICASDAQMRCFKNADNNIVRGDAVYNSMDTISRGQLISGLIWDIRKSNIISLDELSKLVYDSIQFLSSETSFAEFVGTLVKSDELNYQGSHKDFILERARARNLCH